jgi:hypothetical protein
MRISPVLLLLPVLVLTGLAAIVVGDRPASPQPAIASPVPVTLTIESLAGTYKGVVDEQELAKLLRETRRQNSSSDEATLKEVLSWVESDIRQKFDQAQITINADGTFESQFTLEGYGGKVKINGNKLIFTADPAKSTEGTGSATKVRQFTFVVSADGKTLLYDQPKYPSKLLRGYVKQ